MSCIVCWNSHRIGISVGDDWNETVHNVVGHLLRAHFRHVKHSRQQVLQNGGIFLCVNRISGLNFKYST